MIEITLPRKTSIVVETPILFAAGTVGYDGAGYRKLIALDQFGGIVTSPVTLKPRAPANGPRLVPLTAGFLLHTGLPNRGIKRVIQEYEGAWKRSVLPIILHIAASTPEEAGDMARVADRCQQLAGLEIGIQDGISIRELQETLKAIRHNTDLPILARLPLYDALALAEVAQRNGADGLVVSAPPRGTERESHAGRLVGGRVYGPWLKAQSLRVVGRVVQYASVPVTGAGGIHSVEDARDFLAAGAVAVQLDSVVWVNPTQAESIASGIGNSGLTSTSDNLVSEWDSLRGGTQPRHLPELPDDSTKDVHFDTSPFEDS